MKSDLAHGIADIRITDTHEHLRKEDEWVERGPRDVLEDLFSNYIPADLDVAGAEGAAIRALTDPGTGDVASRCAAIREAWERVRFTGYGEAVRAMAQAVYGIDELDADAIAAAQPKLDAMRKPGKRLDLLRDTAGLDHVQVDDFVFACEPDASGPEFFLYDLSWVSLSSGQISTETLHQETGVTVTNLATLRQAMEGLFAKYGPRAVAVKTQHAYGRTLQWRQRNDSDADRVLRKLLAGAPVTEAERLCLGDWCIARGVELAGEHNLPFKIHTGYYAGSNYMLIDRIRPGHLAPLLVAYPKTRFVLMHIGYPYGQEMIALAKHFRNVYVDLCWAWSIDPYSSMDFVRRFIHTAPANKLFGFGGDTFWPTSAVGYAMQTRRWLTRTLTAEVADGLMTEAQAMGLAKRLLHDNAYDCFDIDATRRAIRDAAPKTREPVAAK